MIGRLNRGDCDDDDDDDGEDVGRSDTDGKSKGSGCVLLAKDERQKRWRSDCCGDVAGIGLWPMVMAGDGWGAM